MSSNPHEDEFNLLWEERGIAICNLQLVPRYRLTRYELYYGIIDLLKAYEYPSFRILKGVMRRNWDSIFLCSYSVPTLWMSVRRWIFVLAYPLENRCRYELKMKMILSEAEPDIPPIRRHTCRYMGMELRFVLFEVEETDVREGGCCEMVISLAF